MDAIVAAALKKWPNVPHCYAWLALDARGDWYMRDDRIQAAGPFPRVKGSRIDHDKLREFIGRNYGVDADGAWFFQNGPQRVYVDLEAAPWVWRLQMDAAASVAMTGHTGIAVNGGETFVDEHGRVFVATDAGLGIVHTQDVAVASDAIERGAWPAPQEIAFDALVARFGVRLSPAADRAR